MRKIIAGLVYDTESATLIGSASYSGGRDFRAWEEDLYRTPRGRFFLRGEGGPMTSWAVSTGQNSWSGGSDIRALTEAEAREWAEKYLSAEEYERAFGAAEEA